MTTGAPASATGTSPTCSHGTVTVAAQFDGQPSNVCVTVGSTIVMTGGSDATGGTWPGPPHISNGSVLRVISSNSSGATYSGRFIAWGTGASSVTVPFVNGPDVCTPTPCTPVPGGPLVINVTVVS
ncbi:MAG TPA: hypothetical protein VGF87_09480 [Acidimicrobiales bacterium]